MNPYETLGVAEDATKEEIRAAYQRLASTNHPDRGGDAAAMAAITSAYRVLGNVERRREYDATHEMPGFQITVEGEAKQLLGKIVNDFIGEDRAVSKTTVSLMVEKQLRASLLKSKVDLERRLAKYEKALKDVDPNVRAGAVIAHVINGHLDSIRRNLDNVNHSLDVLAFLDEFIDDWTTDGMVVGGYGSNTTGTFSMSIRRSLEDV